jgi:hypothetical protein
VITTIVVLRPQEAGSVPDTYGQFSVGGSTALIGYGQRPYDLYFVPTLTLRVVVCGFTRARPAAPASRSTPGVLEGYSEHPPAELGPPRRAEVLDVVAHDARVGMPEHSYGLSHDA